MRGSLPVLCPNLVSRRPSSRPGSPALRVSARSESHKMELEDRPEPELPPQDHTGVNCPVRIGHSSLFPVNPGDPRVAEKLVGMVTDLTEVYGTLALPDNSQLEFLSCQGEVETPLGKAPFDAFPSGCPGMGMCFTPKTPP